VGAAELRGSVRISGTVIVPKTVPLIIEPGTDITMMPSANVVSYGGLTAIGTVEKPIRIHGLDSGQIWGVLAVVRPKETVVLRHTEISEAGQGQINSMLFTGGFAVHDGDLDLAHCRFINMNSEDGLNLKNGQLAMRDCYFEGNASDGIDIDFGKGYIENCQFVNISGDGVDLSGSEILISNCRFENIADKGVSVGENSHPILVNNLFRNCGIGFSTKDLSRARVAHSTFIDNRLAIEAKRKKPFFGGASAEVVNSVFSGNQELLKEDYFSKNQVTIKNSLVDRDVDWESCETVRIKFLSPEQNDFSVDPGSIPGIDFRLAHPDWLRSANGSNGHTLPGIFLKDPYGKYRASNGTN